MEYLENLLHSEVQHPEAFWLLVPAAVFVFLGLAFGKRGVVVQSLRFLTLSLLVFALAGPIKTNSTSARELTALIDMSGSISNRARAALIEQLAQYVNDDKTSLRVLPFAQQPAAEPAIIEPNSSSREIAERIKAAAKKLNGGDTDIGAAIRTAITSSASASLLLLSDGFETVGNLAQAARYAAAEGVRVYPLIPQTDLFQQERLAISAFHAPLTANAGEKVSIRASVKNSYNEPEQGELEIWMDKEKLFSQKVSIPGSEEKLITFDTPVLKGGSHRLRAVLVRAGLKGAEREKSQVEKHRWLSVKEKAKVLLISGKDEDERVLKELIRLKGYGLENIIADGSTPIPTGLENYSTIVLNNAAKRQLPDGFLPVLKNFVQNGGGLLTVGGDRSYGLGGYIDTPLEEISPLKFVPPTTEKRRLTVAVVLVLDKSGSMAEQNKIGSVKKAALLSVQALKDDDYVSVIGFDNAPFVIIDLKKVGDAKMQAEHRLQNLTAAGQTNLLPALAAARQSLRSIEVSRKHIIVLSDGKFPLSSDAYVGEINSLNREGVTVSAVAMGIEADVPFMKILAKYGKGAFYHTLDPTQLPQIFVYDIKVSTGEKTMKENQQYPVGAGPGGVVSTAVRHFPMLTGFVETLPKRGSTLELITTKDEQIHPILASWRYEQGTVIAFTSDANGRWSLPWLKWIEFPKFWSEILTTIKDRSGTKAEDLDFDLRYSLSGKSLSLDLAIFDQKLRTGITPKVTATIDEPGGETTQVGFRTEKKGRFAAVIENARPGDYKINVTYGSIKLPPLGLTLGAESFGESPGQGLNIQKLEEAAFLTGGTINPDPRQVSGHERVSESKEELFLPLLFAAFALLLLEALIRESGFSFPVFSRRRDEVAKSGRPKGAYVPRRHAA